MRVENSGDENIVMKFPDVKLSMPEPGEMLPFTKLKTTSKSRGTMLSINNTEADGRMRYLAGLVGCLSAPALFIS
jgi:hypothetical protein